MKRTIAMLLAVMMLFALTACGTNSTEPAGSAAEEETPAEPITLYVFAAASMTETLDQVIELYKDVAPNVTIIPTYDGSGALVDQITQGADCDIFISAAQKQMNMIDAEDTTGTNTEGLDFVLPGTRVDILENKVVLAVPDDNPKDIQSFSDLATDKLTLLALGNEDVPVGAYSLEILTALGILDTLEQSQRITYGSNVKEVTTYVKEGTVDAGIIYATDAFSANLTVVDQADTSLCRAVIYPAAVLNVSQNQQAARDFLEFLQSDAAMEVFESVGFAPAP